MTNKFNFLSTIAESGRRWRNAHASEKLAGSVMVGAPDFESGGGGLPVHRQSDARFKWALAPGSWRATAKAQASAASCFARLESFAPPTKSRGLPPGRPEVDALTRSEVSARLKVASFSKTIAQLVVAASLCAPLTFAAAAANPDRVAVPLSDPARPA